MKLNGWHRLWILLSVIYFILVTSYVILEYPKAENIPHQSDFYKKLSKKSAYMINPENYEDALALGGKDVSASPEMQPVTIEKTGQKGYYSPKTGFIALDEMQPVKMPNKHTIYFKAKLSEEDMTIASEEYWRIVKQEATEKRLHLLFYAFLYWVVPCLGFYAFGWSISWVYRGFKQNKTHNN